MFCRNFNIPHLYEVLDTKALRVNFPTSHIFLCGGPCNDLNTVQSFRAAFLKIAYDKPFDQYDILIAEEVTRDFQASSETYDDLLSLESDLAQISQLILLFSESYGSAAELGAFCIEKNIASRLLVVISEENYEENSFVKLGPLSHLGKNYTQSAVYVIPNEVATVCIKTNIPKITSDVNFKNEISSAIGGRIRTIVSNTTFDKEKKGHMILLISGIIQQYGALTKDEIEIILFYMIGSEIGSIDVNKCLFCASQLKWIEKKRSGSEDYFVCLVTKIILSSPQRGESIMPVLRWRTRVQETWKAYDVPRHRVITRAR